MDKKTLSLKSDAQTTVVIGGNFTLNGKTANIAQYDSDSGVWYTRFEPQLYLYGKAAGEVNDLVVQSSVPYDKLYIVGSFDTICRTCQKLYCSTGCWTGYEFEKVGDGLCPRITETKMSVQTTILTQTNELFVGGSFQSSVWSGENFVNIDNIAMHDPIDDAWLPLSGNSTGGGGFGCTWCTASVANFAWNKKKSILYIGGTFDMIDDEIIEPGLAVWSKESGIQKFPGGGLFFVSSMNDTSKMVDGYVSSLAFDESNDRLYVAGNFTVVNNQTCLNIAMWNDKEKSWTCLHNVDYSFVTITSLLYAKKMLFVAGIPTNQSKLVDKGTDTDSMNSSLYTIARLSLAPTFFTGKYDGAESYTGKLRHKNMKRHRNLKRTKNIADRETMWIETSNSDIDFDEFNSVSNGFEEENNAYRYYWEWLPGFTSQSAKINKLVEGSDGFEDSIFICGEFYPPVLIWTDDAQKGPFTSYLGTENSIAGSVRTVVQMQLAPMITSSGNNDIYSPDRNDIVLENGALALSVVVVCIILGICLGVCFAMICHNQKILDLFLLRNIVEGSNGISLNTLASSSNPAINAENDFRCRFERALQARHLTNANRLNMIDPGEIILQKIIGIGSFGRVWCGLWQSSRVAVKEFVFAQAAVAGGSLQRDELIEEIVGEAAVMTLLRHPSILHLYGCTLTSQAIWIVSELCSRGSLRNLLDDQTIQLSMLQRMKIALHISEGMLYLHTQDQPIIHRDLKSHNIFIVETPEGDLLPKIGDWGSARALALRAGTFRTMTHGVGTACWLAPEVIKYAKGSIQSDVYSFGILLWELATREEVYSPLSPAQIIARVANEGLRPYVPADCLWSDIMVKCWNQDPTERPLFSEIVKILKEKIDLYTK